MKKDYTLLWLRQDIIIWRTSVIFLHFRCGLSICTKKNYIVHIIVRFSNKISPQYEVTPIIMYYTSDSRKFHECAVYTTLQLITTLLILSSLNTKQKKEIILYGIHCRYFFCIFKSDNYVYWYVVSCLKRCELTSYNK